MVRNLPIAAVVFAVGCLGAGPASAQEGPWCAFISVGTGAIYEDCQYYSIEACRPVILAGNRGFCNPNPRWVGPAPRPYVRHKRRAYHG
jgi:Protein of unknown function (DUF3551)